MSKLDDLVDLLGPIDIYLLDQVLRGRIRPGMRIFDAGSGGGRNLGYFLRSGYQVCAVDANEQAIDQLRAFANHLAPTLPSSNFRAESIEQTTFPREHADVVISIAVLHFAGDDREFRTLLDASWTSLRPGGLFFCRLASTIGMEGRHVPLGGGRFALLDGSERYLVDAPRLLALTNELGGELLDPLKTTVVDDLRSMTTWVTRKKGGPGPQGDPGGR